MNTYPVVKSVKNSIKQLVKSKQGICSVLVSSAIFLAVNAHAAEPKNFDEMHKQLTIMNNIIQSAVRSDSGANRSKVSSINSIYLHGQGVVFRINARHSTSSSSHFVMPIPPVAPMSPEANFSANGHNEIAIEFESNEDEYEHAIEMFEQQREHSRELRSEQRELSYQLRDIDRESKDAQYQLRHVEEKEKKQLKAELEKLSAKRIVVEQSKAILDKKAKKAQVKRTEQQAIQAKQRVNYFDNLGTTVINTLCMYGNGFKAVPKGEHVSVIFESAGERASRGYQDKVFVFTKKDINACANDKINSKKLLANASKYQF